MSYVIGTLLGLSSFIKKNSKIITGLIFIYIVIIFSFSTNNPDLKAYQNQYYHYSEMFSEPLYLLFSNIFLKLGASYTTFRTFLCLVGYTFLLKTIWDFSPYPTVAIVLYMIYPFTIDVVQVRSFVATSIAVFSIRFIIEYNKDKQKKNIVYFIICILCATGFHYSAIFFGIMGILIFNVKDHWFLFYVCVPLGIVSIAVFLTKLVPIIAMFIGSHKAQNWASGYRDFSKKSLLRVLITRGGMIAIMFFFNMIEKSGNYKISSFKNQLLNFSSVSYQKSHKKEWLEFYDKKVNLILLMSTIYIYMYTSLELFVETDYERLSRGGLILATIFVTRQIRSAKKRNRACMWIILVLFYVLYFASVMFLMSNDSGEKYINIVFRNVMENNIIF